MARHLKTPCGARMPLIRNILFAIINEFSAESMIYVFWSRKTDRAVGVSLAQTCWLFGNLPWTAENWKINSDGVTSLSRLNDWNAVMGLQFENLVVNHYTELLPHLHLDAVVPFAKLLGL